MLARGTPARGPQPKRPNLSAATAQKAEVVIATAAPLCSGGGPGAIVPMSRFNTVSASTTRVTSTLLRPVEQHQSGFPPQPVFWTAVLAVASIKFFLHLYASNYYGYLGDELYFLAAAKRLDWGYVDMPPGVALYAWIGRHLFGESLPAIRFVATVAGTAKVVLTGMIAARMGGNRAAQGTACLTVLVAPIYLIMDSLLTMNAVEPLFWMGAAYVLILIIQTGDERLWMWFGVLIGLGLQNKHSTVFFAFAVLVALLLTTLRRSLAQKWIWIGGALAFATFLPNLIWQYQNGFPTLELLLNVNESRKMLAPSAFILEQVFILWPPLWIVGLFWLLFQIEGRRYRVLGLAYLVLLITFILLKAKNYYLVPIYPMLIATGAVALQRWLRRQAVLLPVAALLIGFGTLAAFVSLPLLKPEDFLALQRKLGLVSWRSTQSRQDSALPPRWADQFGWEEMTAEVARAYRALPPQERTQAAILAGNYRDAAAIEFFGRKHGLAQPISPHQNYFLWGPREYNGKVALVIGFSRSTLEEYCGSVATAGRFYHPYALPEENGEFYVCRDLKLPTAEFWRRVKLYH